MKAEVMIYIYGAVCISMIIFNICYSLALKRQEPRMEKRCRKMKNKIERQLYMLETGHSVEQEHIRYLNKQLRKINQLIAFQQVLQNRPEQDADLYEEYLLQIRPVVLYLADIYRSKENMQAGYFAYFLAGYTVRKEQTTDSLQEILLDYVRKNNLYCRFNALKSLYHFASPGYIAEAVRIQDDGRVFLHDKLLTEGLLSYTGDHSQLISALLGYFPLYSVPTQLAILNYIRFCSGNYPNQMLNIMNDKEADKELRLAAIRYFGKYPFPDAKPCLIKFVANPDTTRWEYASVAASSLSIYPGEDVIAVLKSALHRSSWYIRYAAAQSLQKHDPEYSSLIDIMSGDDRYAREMMMYLFETRRLKEQED